MDDAFKRMVLQVQKEGGLPASLRVSPNGVYGIDVWDSATGVGWDLTTATVRQTAQHDARYLFQVMPDGTTIIDVNPIVYSMNW